LISGKQGFGLESSIVLGKQLLTLEEVSYSLEELELHVPNNLNEPTNLVVNGYQA